MIPFLSTLERAERVLIAGCGGGFDVFAGVPIAQQAMRAGKQVIFANFSFTNLWLCGGEQITPTTWRVDERSDDIPYFPERWLAEWLAARGRVPPIYAFAKSGVRPLRAAYSLIMERHDIDLCVLVDGGTDSVLFGDEPSLGTVVEDAVSTVAACAATEKPVILAAIGFGVDHHHGVSHHAFLENAARLTHGVRASLRRLIPGYHPSRGAGAARLPVPGEDLVGVHLDAGTHRRCKSHGPDVAALGGGRLGSDQLFDHGRVVLEQLLVVEVVEREVVRRGLGARPARAEPTGARTEPCARPARYRQCPTPPPRRSPRRPRPGPPT